MKERWLPLYSDAVNATLTKVLIADKKAEGISVDLEDHRHPGSKSALARYDLHMYSTLCFSVAQPSAASRFEIYYQFASRGSSEGLRHANAATTAPSESGWTWLGTAFALKYRVCELTVPVTADSVQVLIQPADVMGKLVPMADGTVATVDRP